MIDAIEANTDQLRRIAVATEELAEQAQNDPLRAIDRMLAMGIDPETSTAQTLETMTERGQALNHQNITEKAAQKRQEGPGATEGAQPESAPADLEAAFLAGLQKPAAPKKKSADDTDIDELPEHEKWRLG